jgi:hypothetical protein
MPDAPILSTSPRAHCGQTAEALAHLEKVVVDGLRHGFFEYAITCEIGSGGKRHLVIRAGKSLKFTIPEDELPR